MSENGHGEDHLVKVVLTYDKNTMVCEIGCSQQSLEVICQVLASASRQADVSYRVSAGIQAQQQITQRNKDLALAEEIRRRGAR